MWAISSLTSFLILWVMPQKHFEKFPLAGRCFVTKTLRLDSDTLFYYEFFIIFPLHRSVNTASPQCFWFATSQAECFEIKSGKLNSTTRVHYSNLRVSTGLKEIVRGNSSHADYTPVKCEVTCFKVLRNFWKVPLI